MDTATSVVFLNSHPIQYFAPLYKEIAENTPDELEVLFCSDESIKGKEDKGFGTQVKWDIPLLEGYQSKFLRNYSPEPSIHKGFWGLMNLGIVPYLFKKKKTVLIIHGWGYCTHVLGFIFGKLAGHKVCVRGETPYNQEILKKGKLQYIKRIWLRFLFSMCDYYLYIGTQNRLFYKSFGVNDQKLLFTPYCVDNKRFQNIYHSVTQGEARERCGLPGEKKIILFSAKYISKKRPLDLLYAFKNVNREDIMLVMVGEGELRPEMEAYIKDNGLRNVVLTGFVNQSLIPYYYAVADIFVMCSGLGETWGLSVNEAMNFGLPVVISNICGCATDLVEDGVNGFIYEVGDIDQLTDRLNRLLDLDGEKLVQMSRRSLDKINEYSYSVIIKGIASVK